jgi:RHS repeat-associated protein
MKKTCHQGLGPFAAQYVGDPIDVVSGASVDRALDFTLDGPLPVRWFRHYDSRWNKEDRGLGYCHRHAFDEWLLFDLDGITYRSAQGYETYFPHLVHNGERASRVGRTLIRIDERNYELREHAQPTLHFSRGQFEARLVALSRDGERITLQYDGDRLDKVLAPRDHVLKLEWDASGHLIAVWHRPPEGDRKALIRYRYQDNCLIEGVDAYQQKLVLQYDASHRVQRRTDRAGYSFFFQHELDGRCSRSWGEDGVLDVQLTYQPLAFETRMMDANGGEWVYQYLPSGALVFITDPYGGVRHFRFSEDGRLLAEVDERGAETHYRFDPAGAPIAKVTPTGEVIPLPDDENRPRGHRLPGMPIEWELGDLWDLGFKLPDSHELALDLPAGVRSAIALSDDWRRGTSEVVADEQGLRLKEVLEDGRERTYGYTPNGGIRRVTDFDGGSWKLAHKSWNHVAEESDPAGNITQYEYSATEQVTAVIDPAGVRTEYGYDLKDRLIEVRRGGPVRERYAYDKADNLIEKRDANGDLLCGMKYDRLGRMTERTLASGEEHSFKYDAHSRYISAQTLKHRCKFDYDWAGRRTVDKRDGRGVEHRFSGEHLIRTTVLDRFVTEYRHVPGGTIVIDPMGGTHRLRSHGRGIHTRDFANGVSETVQYHPRGGQVLSKTRWSGQEIHHQRFYRYSGEGDLLESRDNERGLVSYVHDAAHRLKEVRHANGQVDHYEHNRAGSLFRSPTLEGTVGELNRLRAANGERLEYDERHHIKERVGAGGAWQYDRDSRDQLTGVFWQSPDGRRWGWDAEYDPLGRRIRKSPGYKDDYQYYWDTDRLAAEVLPGGKLRVYVYADAFAMVPLLFIEYASVDAAPESGKRFYLFTDQRGCPEQVIDDDGATVWKARIDPYGYARVEVGAEFYQPLRFPGHFWDSEIGLHYNRFRYYSPELGRYLETDPIGLGGEICTYAYTRSPLAEVDLQGLACPTVVAVLVVPHPDGTRTIVEIVRTPDGDHFARPTRTPHSERPALNQLQPHPTRPGDLTHPRDPAGTWRDRNGALRSPDGRFMREPDFPPVVPTGTAGSTPDPSTLVNQGSVSADELSEVIPAGTPNTYDPMLPGTRNPNGFSYEWTATDPNTGVTHTYTAWGHGPDTAAPANSNSAHGPTARIERVGNATNPGGSPRMLTAESNFGTATPSGGPGWTNMGGHPGKANSSHIPLTQ